jgi:hypothetical protein
MNCKNCEKPLPAPVPGGRRVREFCTNACKQAHYRKAHQVAGVEQAKDALTEARRRIAELEQENTRLLNRLDIERRFHADHEKRSLKAWLKKQPAASIGALGQRILNDALLPPRGSRSFYQASLRAKGYSQDDLAAFEHLWKLLLLS